MVTRRNRVNPLEKRCEDLKILRCLIRPNLSHEKHRSFLFSRLDLLNRTDPGEEVRNADYSMYSTFLTSSSGSVLFSRSNLLKRKDLCFSWLRLGLIRYRRSLRSSHLFSSGLTRFGRVTTREADTCCNLHTTKRRRDKERLFAMMKFANLRENRDNGKCWDWETALRLLNVHTYYPPGWRHYNAFVDLSWKDARIKRTFYAARATYTEPSLSNWNDHLWHEQNIREWDPLLLLLSLISYSKLASWHFPRDSCPYFWEFLS